MNRLLAGLLFGAGLGFLDGCTAWFTPEVRPEIAGILMGSSFKGMVVGLLSALFARKVKSPAAGIAFGAAMGLLFAYFVAAMQDKYYLEIMLPGFTVGAIIGYLTQRTGK